MGAVCLLGNGVLSSNAPSLLPVLGALTLMVLSLPADCYKLINISRSNSYYKDIRYLKVALRECRA
jgi:hypothetical protein